MRIQSKSACSSPSYLWWVPVSASGPTSFIYACSAATLASLFPCKMISQMDSKCIAWILMKRRQPHTIGKTLSTRILNITSSGTAQLACKRGLQRPAIVASVAIAFKDGTIIARPWTIVSAIAILGHSLVFWSARSLLQQLFLSVVCTCFWSEGKATVSQVQS